MKYIKSPSKQNCLALLVLLFIIVSSLSLKLNSIENFLNTDNVLSTWDAYRYARFAKEIQGNVCSSVDYLVDVPDFRSNSNQPSLLSSIFIASQAASGDPAATPPFLLSFIAAWLSSALNLKIELLFVFLPPILSVLYIIPFYFWIKELADISQQQTFIKERDGRIRRLLMGLSRLTSYDGEQGFLHYYLFFGGAFLGLFNFIYAIRTPPGYFDTDCLILLFVFLILMFITRSVKENNNALRSYTFLSLAAVIFKLFMLEYNVYIFAPFFVFSVIAGLLGFKHSHKDVFLKTSLFVLLIDPIVLWYGLNIKYYLYAVFLKERVNALSISIFSTINEFQPVTLKQFVSFTTDNYLSAFLAALGLVALFIHYFRYMVIALPIIGIGLSAFTSGNRYIMYLAPFLGMGIGYIVALFIGFLKNNITLKPVYLSIAGMIIVAFLSFPPQRLHYKPVPFLSKELFEDYKKLKEITEKNAYMLSWWDYGFIIEYLAERGTYVDGSNYHPAKMYFIAKSLMTDNETEAKNSIAFISNNLTKDYLKKDTTLSGLAEKAYAYDGFPTNPVYVVIDRSMIEYSFIHKLGLESKQISDDKFPLLNNPNKCRPLVPDDPLHGPGEKYDCRILTFDLAARKVSSFQEGLNILDVYREITFIDRNRSESELLHQNNKSTSDKTLQIILAKDANLYFMVADPLAKNSLLNRMYAMKGYFNNFMVVYDDFPHMVVYKMKRT